MNATEILRWAVKESIAFENVGTVDVPEEGEYEWQQNEEWWLRMFGGLPPGAIAPGFYLYYCSDTYDEIHTDESGYISPDAEIEITDPSGFIYYYLYKID